MKEMTAKEIVSRIPCACSDCGMDETKAMEMIAELLKEEKNKAIDDVVLKIDERISGYAYIEGEDIAMLIRELMELKPILESLKAQ